VNLLDLTPAEAEVAIAAWLRDRNEPRYRMGQILPRLWQRPVTTWGEVTDLPLSLRQELDSAFPLRRPQLEALQQSNDGTVKFLWRVEDAAAIESVLIPERRRRTLCISSQEGCAYGCSFCATARMGLQRHLSAWEIAAQVRELSIDSRFEMPTHIVYMGMGEPLHNWNAVDRSLSILNDGRGMGIGARRITISTIGIVRRLRQLAQRPEQFRVALSLHAPNSTVRARLMPVERKYPLDSVLETLRLFSKRVTFEYVMIRGVNDSDAAAVELADLAREFGALVNLLPLNPGGAADLEPTPAAQMTRFAAKLKSHGAKATIRRSRGLDISGACGQLRIEVAARGNIETQDYGGVDQ
jgi:23S rRNA (adenine2503-C2)-methyltransferase